MHVQNDTGFRTFLVGTGGVTVYDRVKLSSGTIVVAGAGEDSIGIAQETKAADAYGTVKLWSAPGTFVCRSAGAITSGAAVYGAAAGEIDDTVSGNKLGIALEAATDADQHIEVLPARAMDLLAMQTLIADPAATAADITDNSGGTDPGDDTIAAVTNLDSLTDSTGGSADDTLDAVTQQAGGAGVELTDGDPAKINNNFKELADQIATQKTANTAILAAIAQLAAKHNTLKNDIEANNAAIDSIIDALQANGIVAAS